MSKKQNYPALIESEVHALIALEPSSRNRVLLRLTYGVGLRVFEICALKWEDAQGKVGGGQITVSGRCGKVRHVLLSPETWRELLEIRAGADPDAPVFPSRKGAGHLSPSAVWRVVQAAGLRAGIHIPVPPSRLRKTHICHSLDRENHIHLIQDPLGLVTKERRMEILEADNRRLQSERLHFLDKNRSRFMAVDGD